MQHDYKNVPMLRELMGVGYGIISQLASAWCLISRKKKEMVFFIMLPVFDELKSARDVSASRLQYTATVMGTINQSEFEYDMLLLSKERKSISQFCFRKICVS